MQKDLPETGQENLWQTDWILEIPENGEWRF